MKRLFDFVFSILGLIIFSPIFLILSFIIFLQDGGNPFYQGERIGLNKKKFFIVKLRSMRINAEKSGVDSTSNDDERITSIGSFIRKYKIDEISQLWNVFRGEMSIVGPRPNVKKDVDLYTSEENKICNVKPGITDFSSIVFSDEGEILLGSSDPDLAYNQLIRPWKSRLALIYINYSNLIMDIKIIIITILAIFNKSQALHYVVKILEKRGIEKKIIDVVRRNEKLKPYPPPGSNTIITKR